MSPKELADRLNGVEYPAREIRRDYADLAKQNNLVIAYGMSDDLLEFRGAIYGEFGAYDGTEVLFLDGKPMDEVDLEALPMLRKQGIKPQHFVKSTWEPQGLDASWLIETSFPGAVSFDIMEDGRIYCRGIVFPLVADEPKDSRNVYLAIAQESEHDSTPVKAFRSKEAAEQWCDKQEDWPTYGWDVEKVELVG